MSGRSHVVVFRLDVSHKLDGSNEETRLTPGHDER